MKEPSRIVCILALVLASSALVLGACGGDEEDEGGGGGEATPTEPAPPPLPEASPIAAGHDHTCAVKESGEAFCWGRNLDGELGDGTGQNRRTPVPVRGLTDVHQIAPGYQHTCALKRDGTVWCWGRNDHGQLGDGTTDPHATPVQVQGVSDAIQVATGQYFSCALLRGGTAMCWGEGDEGRLGTGSDQPSPAPAEVAALTDATQIDAGFEHACARKSDGTVWCWGADDNGQTGLPGDRRAYFTPTQVPQLTGITQVSTGGDNTCAVHEDGHLSCWGDVYRGKVGNGQSGTDPDDVESPFQLELTGVQEVGVGNYQVCARLESGAVQCWGDDGYGNLGAAERGDQAAPTEVFGLADAQQLAVGGAHVCALRATGALSCWGKSGDGQLGAEDMDDTRHAGDRIPALASLSAEPPPIPTFEAQGPTQTNPRLSVGQSFACGVRQDGHVLCWGSNHSGQLGNGTTISAHEQAVEVIGLGDAVQVEAYQGRACARRANGQVACWGSLGRWNGSDSTVHSSRPLPLEGISDATGLALGSTPCVLREGGTVTCVSGGGLEPVEGLAGAVEVVGAAGSFCARMDDGGVRCWGSNSHGQAGDGTTDYAREPVEVSGIDDATSLAYGFSHACALREGGRVSCWGNDRYGQIGDGRSGEDTDTPSPASVRGVRNAVEIAAGTSNSLARLEDGSILCWGEDDRYQCGTGNEEDDRPEVHTRPVEVAVDQLPEGLGEAVQMDCGWNACCTLRSTGQVACWGSSSVLGSGTLGGLVASRASAPRPLTQVSLGSAAPPQPSALAEQATETDEAGEAEAAEADTTEAEATEAEATEATAEADTTEEPARPRRSHRQQVEAAVRQSAQGCFNRLGTHGAVSVRVTVGPDGRVTTSRVVNNSTGNREIGRCISGSMVGRRFTRPRQGAVTFTIPFNG
ncbi:MAG TPA: AgmX/PglI C-terminal domain-containing protein [Sandaracinaceae bacterium LLY-WYZ-13_1]|nr:AgmX/PglI C-terminal domain-containing protein [Sandaracinaceae bacterium LLY-WYZ-13_1]